MKLVVNRYWLEIRPEDEVDEAYIEEVLGLKNGGDTIHLVRENCAAMSCLLGMRTLTPEQNMAQKEPPA